MDISDATAPNEPSPTSVATTSHRVYLLGEQHSVSRIQELREMLHSVAPNVRRLAASAFYKLADLDFDKQPVVKDLVVIGCSDTHPQVRQYALKALKRYVAFMAQYEGCIAKVAQDQEQKDYVRQAAQNLCDLISTSRSNVVAPSSRCTESTPAPTYKEIISHPSQDMKGEQLITRTAKAMPPIQVKGGAGSGKTTTGAIALYERGRFAEFMQFSEGIEDADVICLRAFLKNDGMGCVKDMAGAETLINGIIDEIKVRAEHGNVVSQTNLAKLYRDGLGVKCDYATSVKWYCKAAERGYARAQNGLASMYVNGHGVDKNEILAVKWFNKAAEQGYAPAQNNLGVRYENGQGVAKDDSLAVEWYRKAAEQGRSGGQYNLGRMYEYGRGVAKDYVMAVEWYRKAAEQGRASGQYKLGRMYESGCGVEQDDVQAVEWYRKAAEQGYAKAQCSLGWMYANGHGVEKDYVQAVEWCRKSAEQGYAWAQNILGVMYANGRGVEKDNVQAVEWYRKAAEQGFARAQCNLGRMCANGCGMTKDDAQAVEWYRKAAEQGLAEAQCNLAVRYENGQGVEKDDAQAVTWYRKAAEQGLAEAQNRLGVMCQNGRGVTKDDVKAVEWYRKAAKQGYAEAQFHLGWMYKNGYGVAKDDVQALEWYRKAAEKGNASAQNNLGAMYEFGFRVNPDRALAIEWYRKAANQGLAKAKENLASILEGRKDDGIVQLDYTGGDGRDRIGQGNVDAPNPSTSIREAAITNNEELQIHHSEDVLWARQVVPLGHVPPQGWGIRAKNVKARLLPQRYLVRRKGITNHQDRKDFPYDFVATLAAVAIDGLSEIHNVAFLPFQWNEIARQACSRDRIYIRAEWLEVPLESGWVSRSKGREYFRGRLIYPTLLEVVKNRTDRGEALPTAEKLLALRLEDEDLQSGLGAPLTTSK